MRFCFLDNSFDYKGLSPDRRALGGAEKALFGLSGALAARGHEVIVANRTTRSFEHNGVDWVPLESVVGQPVDVSVAFRAPALLGLTSAHRDFLWITSSPDYLDHPAVSSQLLKTGAGLLFSGPVQRHRWYGQQPAWIMPVGLRAPFLGRGSGRTVPVFPVAVVTTHPRRGLDRLLYIWCTQIRPAVPAARLLVLSRCLGGGRENVPVALESLFRRLEDLAPDGVEVCCPPGDSDMAALWSRARVHLYPAFDDDVCCWTLAESQACGVPAVAGSAGGASDRVDNGMTGYCVPDDAALAGVTVQILQDDGVFANLSAAAGAPSRHRSWDDAAVFLETLSVETCV